MNIKTTKNLSLKKLPLGVLSLIFLFFINGLHSTVVLAKSNEKIKEKTKARSTKTSEASAQPKTEAYSSSSSTSANSSKQTITICSDVNFWYPFTYVRNHQAKGLHIDIIRSSLQNLGYDPIFKPMSWKQCLDQAKEGKVDAVATASYRDNRSAYLNYPPGAAVDRKSPWRVTEVEYVVITSSKNEKNQINHYEFNGDVKTLPQPVRVPANYSVAEDLRREGLKVEEGKNSLANFKNLLKQNTGSVVDLIEVADYYAKNISGFANKYDIQKKPLNLKSYYLAFSKKSPIPNEDIKRIWEEIAHIRDDQKLMHKFLDNY